jgi:hypothetical protein
MDFLNPGRWLLYGAFVAALALGAWRIHHNIDQGGYDRAMRETAAAVAAQVAIGKQKSADLLSDALILERVKNAEIKAIDGRLNIALGELRNRPERRTDVPETAGACAGATGAELSRPDGEFLERLAADADRQRAALKQCYEVYDKVRAVVAP